jgi:hypothetical protein
MTEFGAPAAPYAVRNEEMNPARRHTSSRQHPAETATNASILLPSAVVFFEICSEITEVETFATGASIRELPRLRKMYGKGAQTKGDCSRAAAQWYDTPAELHWYEATGIGKKDFKIKRFVD